MTGDEGDAVDALERLGLTGYEAKTFIALQKLGSGTARDVARLTDVPRSQVYSAAESLADRGLVDVQQSSPMEYRPVSVEEARNTLRDRFETESDRAFEYIDHVRTEQYDEEEQEDIWTLRGRDQVAERATDLVRGAEEYLVVGFRLPELVTDDLVEAVRDRAAAGVETRVFSIDPTVRERFADIDGVTVWSLPSQYDDDDRSGRVVYADDDSILLSVLGREEVPGFNHETAIWSADSNFAAVLIQLIETSLGRPDA